MGDPFAVPADRRPSPLPVVVEIRAEVAGWRVDGRYEGATATSRRLLQHWFLDEHQDEHGEPFAFYFCQREAMETLVYLHEVAKVRSAAQLVARYGTPAVVPLDLPYARYVVKMATGSGKTKVMALALAWAYFSALYEEGSSLPSTYLLVAPNLIVLERLRADFDAGHVFRTDPIIPPEWRLDFDLQVVIRDEPAPMTAPGVLALTNVHVLYDRPVPAPTNPVEAALGPRPPKNLTAPPPLIDRLAERGRLMVINDEAHHLHDEVRSDTGEPLVALRSLQALHERSDGIEFQLDLSATPRHQDGSPFAEIVVNYPLSTAIDDGIVKRPIIGELHGDLEVASDDASVRYRPRLGAGVAKWREFRDALAPVGKKPLLFVMAESTKAADQIASWLETVGDLAGRVLTIHVNMSGANKGEIAKRDLELAREAARQVDQDDSPYEAIVSVLMLREGWDVRNVSVIVPLRPYTASSNILPEQTLGRGLRRMTAPGSGVDERVVVIEHEAFRTLWENYVEREGLDVDFSDVDDAKPTAEIVAVDPDRLVHDLEVPRVGRRVARAPGAVGGIGVEDVPARYLSVPDDVPQHLVDYLGRDLRSGTVVESATYPLPRADDAGAVLAWYVNEVQRRCRLTAQFAVLAPLVRDYLEQRAFAEPVELDDLRVLHALAQPATQETVLEALRSAVDHATLQTGEGGSVTDQKPRLLSATRPFLWSGPLAEATRSIFPRQPCDSGFEVQFVGFLDRCPDVAAFAKLAPAMRLSMEYRSPHGGLAFYYPDFVVRDVDDGHYLVETKGMVDLAVPAKDLRAAQWCLDATMVSGTSWSYLRVDEDLFERHARSMATFAELHATVAAVRRAQRLATLPKAKRRSREEILTLMGQTSARTRLEPPDLDDELNRFRDR